MSWTGPDCFAGLKADLTTDSDVSTVVSDVKAYLGTTFGPNMSGEVAALTLTKPEVLASLDHYKTYLDSQFDDSAHFSKGQSQMLARLRSQVAALATLGHFLTGDSGLSGQKLDNAIALLQKNWAKKTFFHKDIGVPHAALMASAKPKLDQLLSNAPIEIHPTAGEAAAALPDAGDGGTVDTGATAAAPAEAPTGPGATTTGWTPPANVLPGEMVEGDHVYTHDDGTPGGQTVVVPAGGSGLNVGELGPNGLSFLPADEAKSLIDHGFPGFTDQGVWNGATTTPAEVALAEHAYAFYGLSITPSQAAQALADLPTGIINVNSSALASFGHGFDHHAFVAAKLSADGGGLAANSYTAFYKSELEKIAAKGSDLPEALPWPPPPLASPEGQAFVHAAAAGNAMADAVQTGDHGVDIAGVHLTTTQATDFKTALENHAVWGNWVYDNLPNPTTSLDAIQAWVSQTLGPSALHQDADDALVLKYLKDNLAVPSAATVDLFGFQAPADKAQQLLELMKAKAFATDTNPNGPVKAYLDHVFGDSYKATTPGSNIDLDEVNAYVTAQTGTGTLGAGPSKVFDAYVSKLESLGLTATAHPDPLAHLPVLTHVKLHTGDDGLALVPGDVAHESGTGVQAVVHADGSVQFATGTTPTDVGAQKVKDGVGWHPIGKGPEAAPVEAELPVVDHTTTLGVAGHPVGPGDVVYQSPSGMAQQVVHPGGGQAPDYISAHTQSGVPSTETAESLTASGWKPVAKGPDVAALPAVPTLPVFDASTLPAPLLAKLAPGDVVLTHPGTNTIVLKHLDGSYDTAGPNTVTASHWNPGEGSSFEGTVHGWAPVGTIPGTPAVGDLPVVTHATFSDGTAGHIVAPGDVVHAKAGVAWQQAVVHPDGSVHLASGVAAGPITAGTIKAGADGWHPVGKGPDLAVTPVGLQIVHDDGSFTNLSDAAIPAAVKDLIVPGDKVWVGTVNTYVQHEGATDLVKVHNATGSISSTAATDGALHALDSPTGGWTKHVIAGGSHPAIANLQHAATEAASAEKVATQADVSAELWAVVKPGDHIYESNMGGDYWVVHPDGTTHILQGDHLSPTVLDKSALEDNASSGSMVDKGVVGGTPATTADKIVSGQDMPKEAWDETKSGDQVYKGTSYTYLHHPDTGTITAVNNGTGVFTEITAFPQGVQSYIDALQSNLGAIYLGVVPDKLDIPKGAQFFAKPGDHIYTATNPGSSATYFVHPDGQVGSYSAFQGFVDNGQSLSKAQLEEMVTDPSPGVADKGIWGGVAAPAPAVVYPDIPAAAAAFAKPGDDIWTTSGSIVYYVHPDGTVGKFGGIGAGAYTETGISKSVVENSHTTTNKGVWPAGPSMFVTPAGVIPGATPEGMAALNLVTSLPANVTAHLQPGDAVYKGTAGGTHYLVHTDGTVSTVGVSGAYTQSSIATQSTVNNWLASGEVTHLGTLPAPGALPTVITAPDPNAILPNVSVPTHLIQPGDHIFEGDGGDTTWLAHTDGTTSIHYAGDDYLSTSTATEASLVANTSITDKGVWPGTAPAPGVLTVGTGVSGVSQEIYDLALPGDKLYEGPQKTYFVHTDGSVSALYDGDHALSHLPTSAMGGEETDFAGDPDYTVLGTKPAAPVPVGGLPGVGPAAAAYAKPGDHVYGSGGPDGNFYFAHPDGTVSVLYSGADTLESSGLHEDYVATQYDDKGVWPSPTAAGLPASVPPAVAAAIANPIVHASVVAAPADAKLITDLPPLLQVKAKAGDTWYYKANTGHHYVVHADGTGHGVGPTATHATSINPGNQIAHSVKQGTIFDGSALPAAAAGSVPDIPAAAVPFAKPGDKLYTSHIGNVFYVHTDGTVSKFDVHVGTSSELPGSDESDFQNSPDHEYKGVWPGAALPASPTADTFWSMPSAIPGQNIQIIAHPDGTSSLITPGSATPFHLDAGAFDPANPAWAAAHQTPTLEAPSVDPLAFLTVAPGDKPPAYNNLSSYVKSNLFTPTQGYSGGWNYTYNPDILSEGASGYYGTPVGFTQEYLTQVGIDPTDAPVKIQMQAVVAHATNNKTALAALLPQFPSINAAAAKAPTVLVGLKPLNLTQIKELQNLINSQSFSNSAWQIEHNGKVKSSLGGVIAIEKVKEWGGVTTGVNSAFKTAKSKNGVLTYLDNYASMAKAQEMAVNPDLTVELLYDPQASMAATHLSTPANTASLSSSAGMPSTGVLQGPKVFAAAPMPGGGGYSNSRDIAQFNFIFKPHSTSPDGSVKKSGVLLTGVHPKEILVDQYGQEWLYKPAPEVMRADAEHYGMVLQRAFTGVAPTSGVIKGADIKGDYKAAPGEVGVVQRMFQKASDLKNVDVATLTDFHLRDIMSSHVFDWLIANDDSKPDNLMVLNNNRIAGIDKARAFRHFGADKLALGSLDGNAPTIYTTVYNHFISQLKYGTTADKEAIAKLYAFTIQRAKLTGSMMSDDDYRAVLAQLFAKRTDWSATAYSTRAQVIDAAVFRKNNMADDFTKLWKQIYNQAGEPIPDIDDTPTRLVADELTGRSPDLWEEVKTVSGGGKVTFFNSTDMQGGAEFWWRALRDKQDGTGVKDELHGEIHLLDAADTKLHAWLQSHEINPAQGSSYGANAVSAAVSSEPGYHAPVSLTGTTPTLPGQAKAWKALFEYAKTVNTHANDGDYNSEKIAAGENLKAALDGLGATKTKAEMNAWLANQSASSAADLFPKTPLTAAQYPAFKQMIDHYAEQIKIPEVAKANSAKTASKVEDFVYTPTSGNPLGLPDNVYAKASPGDHLYSQGGTTFFVHPDGTLSKVENSTYSYVSTANTDLPFLAAHTTDLGVIPGAEPFDPTKVVAAPVVAGKQFVKSVTSYDHLHYELGTFDADTGLVTYKGNWFDTNTQHSGGNWGGGPSGTNYRIDFGNGVHAEYTPTQPWDHSQNGAHHGLSASQGRFRLTVENWTGDDSQLEPYYAMLHDIGMDLTPATEESLQLQYWSQLTSTIKARKDSTQYQPALAYIQSHVKADTTPADAIAAYREAYKLQWDPQLVDEADWRPHFQHEDPDDPTTVTGRPYWNRPDKSYADLVRIAGSKGLRNIASTVGSQQAAIVKSGGMVATEEKLRRLGLAPGGETQSPWQDANSGGSNFVYTRQGGNTAGVYYNPDALLRLSTFSLESDGYGNIHNPKTYWEPKTASEWASINPNETLFRNSMTVLDDIEVMLVSAANRTQILNYFSSHGITDIRGLPPEDRFITVAQGNSATVTAALAKAWDVWKARRGILTAAQTTRKWEESPEGIAEAAARAKWLVDHPGSS